LQAQIQQNDKNFQFPFLNVALTLTEIRINLNKATKDLHAIQKGATEMRFKTYQDLLAKYTADNDPETRPDSNRKAKIVKRTIRTERIRTMFRNIRSTIKNIIPSQQSGITQIKVPRIDRSGTSPDPNPDEFQDYISKTSSNDIIWDTVLDQRSIETYLLRYNQQSFRAAATSPCGHGIIYNALSFTSLTQEATQFLHGILPPEWYGNDLLLKEFLLAFMIPQHIRDRPPIKTTLSEDDILQGITRWKETTATSPSGRHLGHYKAIVQDPVLLQCLTKFMHIAVKFGIPVTRWTHATNVMLEKDPGNPCIHRLRIIHLFGSRF
jgi:hypothetical protein